MDMRYDGAERGGTEFAISGVCLSNAQTAPWSDVCVVDDILPGTGVCGLVADRHVAVFRTGDDQFFAIDNVDPKSGASVLARGLMGSLGGRVVDSPLYKNHFDLHTRECLEEPDHSVRAYGVRADGGRVAVVLG